MSCTDAGSHCGAFVPGATCTPNNKDVHLLTNVSAELCLTACERQVIVIYVAGPNLHQHMYRLESMRLVRGGGFQMYVFICN